MPLKGHPAGELWPKRGCKQETARLWLGKLMVYKIVAERENQKLQSERASVLIAIAKARVWASEGWQVVVTDGSGTAFVPEEFDDLVLRVCPVPKPN
jgi:hypothetical protein